MPAPHHSIFYRPDAIPAAQPTASKHWRHWINSVNMNIMITNSNEILCTLKQSVCWQFWFGCLIDQIHDIESLDYGTLKRVQGVAIPRQLPVTMHLLWNCKALISVNVGSVNCCMLAHASAIHEHYHHCQLPLIAIFEPSLLYSLICIPHLLQMCASSQDRQKLLRPFQHHLTKVRWSTSVINLSSDFCSMYAWISMW